jgi:hypothetical protein
MINIISSFYVSKYSSNLDNARSEELKTCLCNNMKSPFVEKIHLFVDDNDALDTLYSLTKTSEHSDKIVIIDIKKKPFISDFFDYILNNIRDKICMITNSDIYLYSVDLNLISRLNDAKITYALTRHEHDMSHPLINRYQGSHDSYIFNSKYIDKSIINEHTQYYQNIPGIESHIISAFCNVGFSVFNPCKQIQIVHLHKTNLRKYASRWIGLHIWGDVDGFSKSCWNIPPSVL